MDIGSRAIAVQSRTVLVGADLLLLPLLLSIADLGVEPGAFQA
jgi:hypothetical protein